MTRKRVMIVEDDADVRGLLRIYLEHRTYDCEPLGSAAQCLSRLEQAPPPDLILLDQELPDLDGTALTGLIRAREAWRHVPIVLITGVKLEPRVADALEAGVDACLYKPFSPRVLLAKVEDLIGAPA